MTLRHLKIFVAVCEHKSTTKAAESLYIVQPTVSLAITELEKYYKVKLFDRINQRLVLTDIGKELLVKAKEILTGFEDFESLATFHGQSARVRIGASLTLGQTLIPKFLKELERVNPLIKPQILIRKSAIIESELEQGNLDFAVIGGDSRSPYLYSEPIADDRFVFVANSEFEIADAITLEELVEYPLLLREKGSSSRDFLERVVSEKGIALIPKFDSSNDQALVAALYAELGVAFLPVSYVEGHILRGKLKEIKIKNLSTERTNSLVIHKNKKLNAFQQQAYDLIKTL